MKTTEKNIRLLSVLAFSFFMLLSSHLFAQGEDIGLNQQGALLAFTYPKASIDVMQFDPEGKMLFPPKGLQVFVFPNPAVEQVTVQLSESIKEQIDVFLTDEKGNLLITSCIPQGSIFTCLPVDALPRGSYYVHIKFKDKQYLEKLLLKN